MLYLTNSWASF